MDTYRQITAKQIEVSLMTFYEIMEDLRVKKKMRVSQFLRECGVGSQHRSYWREHDNYSPTPDIMDRLQKNLNIRFVFDDGMKIVGWTDEENPTPTSVRDLVSQPLEGTYKDHTGRILALLEELRGSMDATTAKRLEKEFDIILSKMEDAKAEADHKLGKLFREAERLIKSYEIEVENEDSDD